MAAANNNSLPSHCRFLAPENEAGLVLDSAIGMDASAHDHVRQQPTVFIADVGALCRPSCMVQQDH